MKTKKSCRDEFFMRSAVERYLRYEAILLQLDYWSLRVNQTTQISLLTSRRFQFVKLAVAADDLQCCYVMMSIHNLDWQSDVIKFCWIWLKTVLLYHLLYKAYYDNAEKKSLKIGLIRRKRSKFAFLFKCTYVLQKKELIGWKTRFQIPVTGYSDKSSTRVLGK